MVKVRDVLVVGGIILAFMAVADWRYRHPGPSRWFEADVNDHLGAEYDEIARAICMGRGFSDPFRVPSGPTAWMAPVMPYLLAGIYWAADDNRETVVEIVLLAKFLVLLLTCVIVIGESRRIGRVWLGYAVIISGLTTHFHAMFQRTHDEWLLLLVLDVTWLGIVHLWSTPNLKSTAVIWGVFGGLAALCNPVAGATWAIATSVRWFPKWRSSTLIGGKAIPRCKMLAIAALCSIITVAPWTVRNRIVLGAWIPIKSNCIYEIWQSQCLDDNGVVDRRTFVLHPWASAGEQRDEYLALGELRFIARRWPEVRRSMAEAPTDALHRIANRFLAACLWYQVSDREQQQGTCIVNLKRWVFALPFLCFVLLLWSGRCRRSREIAASMWIYAVFLCPYVLISYYERYSMPLLVVKMLMEVHGLDCAINCSTRWCRSSANHAKATSASGREVENM